MIHRTPFFLPLLYPSLVWRVPTTEKELYLTFDDGPVSGPTEFVLETLANFNAKATFFCVGENIQKYPLVFKKMIQDGHAIGNHTFNHLNGWRTDTNTYIKNTKQCNEVITEHSSVGETTSQSVPMFRPPFGRITRHQISAMHNFRIIMWDVLSVDYNSRLSVEKCLKNTVQATRRGSIIVFHDSFKAERNLTYTLPRFVEHFSSLGFVFKALRG